VCRRIGEPDRIHRYPLDLWISGGTMSRWPVMICIFGVLLLMGRAAIAADTYYFYKYGNFDVTTRYAERAESLARNLVRLDKALASTLGRPQRHLLTHIYELTPALGQAVIGSSQTSFQGYEVTVVTDDQGNPDNPYWGVLFGYVQSLLVNVEGAGLPMWFQIGVPMLFSNSEFKMEEVHAGRFNRQTAYYLTHRKILPLRVLLRMQPGDPRLGSGLDETRQIFQADCEFLAREIYLEDFLQPEFRKYLDLMEQGTPEADAFEASFHGLTYEDLDKRLDGARHAAAFHTLVVKVPRGLDTSEVPRRLSEAETQARLAGVQLLFGRRPEAISRARAALQANPTSGEGLVVLARASLADGDFMSALAQADALGKLTSPSAAVLTDRGDVLLQLSIAVMERRATSAVGTEADLRKAAREAYEKAVAADPEDLRAWAGLAFSFGKGEQGAAEAFLARVQPVVERHPDSAQLATPLAYLCRNAGQPSCALHFAGIWKSNALTRQDRANADHFLTEIGSAAK
jgi:tetratricopeptide (TPR) repeat protein